MKRIIDFALDLVFVSVAIGVVASLAAAQAPANDNIANAEVLTGMQVHVSRNNFDATKEAGEANHANNPGGKSVWFKWIAPKTRMYTLSTTRGGNPINTLLAIYRGNDPSSITYMNSSDDVVAGVNTKSFLRFDAKVGDTYYVVVDGKSVNGAPADEDWFTLDVAPSHNLHGADYDRDGITDLSIFRPSTGTWWIRRSATMAQTAFQWGTQGDIPMAGFRNGSGVAEYTVFRPSTGTWYHMPTCCDVNIFSFGMAGDIPVYAGFGGESITDAGVFRPSTGEWYVRNYDNTYLLVTQFGMQGDIPVPGLYEGTDAAADLAVFRPSTGTWWVLVRPNNNPNEWTHYALQFGLNGDKPVPADYDGDGNLDIAVYRPSDGTWWIRRSSDGMVNAIQWGIAEDIPVSGDFDADGYADIAVFRPSTGYWYIRNSDDGSVLVEQFGQAGDIPVTSSRGY